MIRREERAKLGKEGEAHRRMGNWLFYFEPNTKNFHYMNVADSTPTFTTVQLLIDQPIAAGSRSILTRNN